MSRIGGRLRSGGVSLRGVIVEIPPFDCLGSNTLEVDSVWQVV